MCGARTSWRSSSSGFARARTWGSCFRTRISWTPRHARSTAGCGSASGSTAGAGVSGGAGGPRLFWGPGAPLAALVPGRIVTGATMAFRSTFRALVLPTPEGIAPMIHDGWIALAIAAGADVAFVDEPLVAYRLHAGQQIGSPAGNRRRLGAIASAA